MVSASAGSAHNRLRNGHRPQTETGNVRGAVRRARYSAVASLRRSVSMGRLGALFRRRVPLYVSIPIVVACGVTGYAASTTALFSTDATQVRIHPTPETSDAAAIHLAKEPSNVTARPGDAPSIVMAVREVELPPPLPRLGHDESTPEAVHDTPRPGPLLVTEATHEQRRVSPAVRAASKFRRLHRMARQPKSAPATASNGLKSVPVIGSVFSLLQ